MLSLAFLLILALSVAITVQIVGTLLIFALLVAPAASALQLTARQGRGIALSVALSLAFTWLGLALAYFTNVPVGFFITTLAFVFYLAVRLVKTRRAVVAPVSACSDSSSCATRSWRVGASRWQPGSSVTSSSCGT